MFTKRSEVCTHGPALFCLLDGFCSVFGEQIPMDAAVVEMHIGIVERQRNGVPISRGRVSLKLP